MSNLKTEFKLNLLYFSTAHSYYIITRLADTFQSDVQYRKYNIIVLNNPTWSNEQEFVGSVQYGAVLGKHHSQCFGNSS